MNEWLIQQGIGNPQTALVVGWLLGLLLAVLLAWAASRRGARLVTDTLQPEIESLKAQLDESQAALAEAEKQSAVLAAQGNEREAGFREQIAKLEQAEKRLAENFERLAGKIFEERSEQLSSLNTKQLDAILKPRGEKLNEFRNTVES